jgi:TIR domain
VDKSKKYQIAISVAEDDLSVASSIATSLKKIGITYYLYTEHQAKNWGEHILKISLDTYGAEAQYVLMITSKIFVEKYWANIERQIVDIFKPEKKVYMLQLRLDDTPVDGLSKHIVYQKWNNDPDRIAALLQYKLNERGREKVWKRKGFDVKVVMALSVLALIFFFYNKISIQPKTTKSQTADSILVNNFMAKDSNKIKVPVLNTNAVDAPKKIVQPNLEKPTIITEQPKVVENKDTNLIKAIETTSWDYCVSMSGNNELLNKLCRNQLQSIILKQELTLGEDCALATKILSISLQESSSKSDVSEELVNTVCIYGYTITDKNGQIIASDTGTFSMPGFSEQANYNNIINQLIKKLNVLL